MKGKWYLETCFICLLFSLSFLVIPFGVGLVLLLLQYRENKISHDEAQDIIKNANDYRDGIQKQCDDLVDAVERKLNEKTEANNKENADFIAQQEQIKDQLALENKSLAKSLDDLIQKYNSIQQECSSTEEKLKNILTQRAKYTDILQENREQENEYLNEQLEFIDLSLDGIEFEKYFAGLLNANGYHHVNVTSASGDYGVDVTATKGGIRFAFQCKCYHQIVGNKAVQQVYSGMQYYKCHIGVVVTNLGFSNSAIEQAKPLNVLLWSRQELSNLIREAYRQARRTERVEALQDSATGANQT